MIEPEYALKNLFIPTQDNYQILMSNSVTWFCGIMGYISIGMINVEKCRMRLVDGYQYVRGSNNNSTKNI